MRRAIVALRVARADRLYLAQEPGGAAFYQGHTRSDTHTVDIPTCIQVVQRTEHHVEARIVREIKLRCLDAAVVRRDSDIRVECLCCLLGNHGLWFLDVLLLEKKLAV